MISSRRILAAVAAALILSHVPSPAAVGAAPYTPATCPSAAEDYFLVLRGSFTPTSIEGSSSLPAPVDEGRFRSRQFAFGCSAGTISDGDYPGLRVGDLMITGMTPRSVTRGDSPGEYVIVGAAWLQHKSSYFGGCCTGVFPRYPYELTVRDVDGRQYSDGGAPADSFTLRVFDVDRPSEVLLTLEADIWGHKLFSSEFCDLSARTCGGASGVASATTVPFFGGG